MSKKTYVAVAAVLRKLREETKKEVNPVVRVAEDVMVVRVTAELSKIFAADNPAFDGERFYAACDPDAHFNGKGKRIK